MLKYCTYNTVYIALNLEHQVINILLVLMEYNLVIPYITYPDLLEILLYYIPNEKLVYFKCNNANIYEIVADLFFKNLNHDYFYSLFGNNAFSVVDRITFNFLFTLRFFLFFNIF